MRIQLGAAAGVLAAALAGQAGAAELMFHDVVARVIVIPEARPDIQVEVRQGSERAPVVSVTRSGDDVTLSGRLNMQQCNFDDEGRGWIRARGGPRLDFDEVAYVTVRTPRSVSISGGGAILGSIGRSQELSLSQDGCANWTAADVAGALQAELSNGANLRAGAVSSARLRADNGGAVRIVRADRLDARATNGGHVAAGAIPGLVTAVATDGGMVSIDGGASRGLSAEAHDGGAVRHKGRVGELRATATDGAMINVEHAARVVSSYASDAGSVIVDDGPG
jgi:hypothetical protein